MKASLISLLIAACCSSAAGAADTFPTRPVTLVVPFTPGALTDTMARQVAQGLGALWGQTVIVENRPGAGGNIGLEHVGRAKPDGYTLLFTPSAPLVTNKLFSKELKVDPDKFAAIAQVSRSTVMMIASNKIAAKTVPELIAYAKANPGKLNFASTGAGSSTHLTSELFMQLAAIKGEIIPYQGISPANIAMMSGDVDIIFDAIGNSYTNIKSGKVHALAVATEQKSTDMPELPLVSDTLPTFVTSLWTGIAAPPGTPDDLAKSISADIAKVVRGVEFQSFVNKLTGVAVIGNTPEEMRDVINKEKDLWVEVLKNATSTGG